MEHVFQMTQYPDVTILEALAIRLQLPIEKICVSKFMYLNNLEMLKIHDLTKSWLVRAVTYSVVLFISYFRHGSRIADPDFAKRARKDTLHG